MARWRLNGKHYLMVPGTEWEYRETTDSGKQVRKIFPVPAYLDPDFAGDQNYPGEIIVSDGVGAQPRDIIFTGPPTPDMAPLDEDAQNKSDAEAPKWKHPIESVNTNGEDTSNTTNILKELAAVIAGNSPSSTVPKAEFDALREQVAELTAALKASTPERRV